MLEVFYKSWFLSVYKRVVCHHDLNSNNVNICRCINNVIPEYIYTETLSLHDLKGKIKSDILLTIRYVIPSVLEPLQRQAVPLNHTELFCNQAQRASAKPGDLILYSGNSIMDYLLKIKHDTLYTHIGLVVPYKNKYTKQEDLYILEWASDFEDSYKKGNRNNIVLYPYQERLHKFNGSAIFLKKIEKEMTTKQLRILEETVWNLLHADKSFQKETKISDSNGFVTSDMMRIYKDLTKSKFERSVDYLTSRVLISHVLHQTGIIKTDIAAQTFEHLWNASCYEPDKTYLLRVLKSASLKFQDNIEGPMREIKIESYCPPIRDAAPTEDSFKQHSHKIQMYIDSLSEVNVPKAKSKKKMSKREAIKKV